MSFAPIFAAFGSGLVEPTTGVVLQNRGELFALTRQIRAFGISLRTDRDILASSH